MKVKLRLFNGAPLIEIHYEGQEWEKIESKLKDLGLKKAETVQGLGMNLEFEYYRTTNEALKKYLQDELQYNQCYDDINKPLFTGSYFNAAVFRIIPENGKVSIRLEKYISVNDLKFIVNGIKAVYRAFFSLITEADVHIRVKEKEVEIK
ncbi:MAG: hypothetical protein DRI44_05390 [Chlamydiae bacterium]|nr:MAG: hypothetical protein DRI44_05390 [Chlamydiota bacterium]